MTATVLQRSPAPHKLTVDDVRAMVESGRLEEGAAVELFDGALFDMPPESPLNISYSVAVGRWLFRTLGDEYAVVPGLSLILSDFDYAKPDWWVFPSEIGAANVRGTDALLAIEQSHSTLRFDLGYKAQLYARHGVRDYWVIDLEQRLVHVHRKPTPLGYDDVLPPVSADESVEALLIPGLVLRLDSLTGLG